MALAPLAGIVMVYIFMGSNRAKGEIGAYSPYSAPA